jgi:hypothetical protein
MAVEKENRDLVSIIKYNRSMIQRIADCVAGGEFISNDCVINAALIPGTFKSPKIPSGSKSHCTFLSRSQSLLNPTQASPSLQHL